MPKNIVLLADGTGNSAASPFKTNVWRLYQALDLAGGTQIALYDDGVGTETFKPLAALGGAFGLGVWKNVQSLYTFLCRNYQPDDSVYLFGFSRGAFTVRLLAGLVARCGAVRATTEQDLRRNVAAAYSAYRRDFLFRATGARRRRLMRWIRVILTRPKYQVDNPNRIDLRTLGMDQVRVNIRFVGVWDTVDAYGMPIDEWKRGIDQVVWPMSVADRNLSDDIRCVRHALSLDDERTTFRPVLWNESDQDGRPIPRERLSQVWFAGVHANVGGGYPDDALAYVALDWMIDGAEKEGLEFTDSYRADVRARANPHGKLYDSRAGVAGYYEYGPRDVERFRNDRLHGVAMGPALLHQTVIDRVANHRVACAPISPPLRFQIVAPDGRITDGTELNGAWMALAWDQVWSRHVVYLMTVFTTIILVLFPVLEYAGFLEATTRRFEAHVCAPLPEACTLPKAVLSFGLTFLGPHLTTSIGAGLKDLVVRSAPAWASFWVRSFMDYPFTAFLLAAMLAWLFFIQSSKVQKRIGACAEMAWADVKGFGPPPPPAITHLDRIVSLLRRASASVGRSLDDWVIPLMFGLATAVFLVLLAAVTFPVSLYAIFRLWRFLQGTDVETFRFGSPTPAPAPVSGSGERVLARA